MYYFEMCIINVMVDVIIDVIMLNDVNQMLMVEFVDFGFEYFGYLLIFGGEFEDMQELVDLMFCVFIVSIILIYVIFGGFFCFFVQLLIVMFLVFFVFIGVIFGFFFFNELFGFFLIIGMIVFVGIVVNDLLIMIDFINCKCCEGFGEIDLIFEVCFICLWLILLMLIIMVFGLLLIVVGFFGVDEFFKLMVIVIGWGFFLLIGFCLILIFCVYWIFDDFLKFFFKKLFGIGYVIEVYFEVVDLFKVDGMVVGS